MNNLAHFTFKLAQPGAPELPEWASYLIQVGSWFGKRAKQSTTKLTVALSMPRVDYGSALLSLGILTEGIGKLPDLHPILRWEMLVGQNVRFDYKGVKKVGKLEAVNKDPLSLQILVRQKEEPDISDWPLADRIKYIPPEITHERVLLPVDKWGSVKPLSKEINLGRQRSVKQSAKDDASVESYDKLVMLFGPTNADRLISEERFLACLVGEKSRLVTELDIELKQAVESDPTKLHEYLRPSTMAQYQTAPLIEIVSTPEKAELVETTPVIVEANRNLPDHLTQTQGCNRIILLGRNASSFFATSDAVLRAFAVRKGNAIDLPAICSSIDSLSFEH